MCRLYTNLYKLSFVAPIFSMFGHTFTLYLPTLLLNWKLKCHNLNVTHDQVLYRLKVMLMNYYITQWIPPVNSKRNTITPLGPISRSAFILKYKKSAQTVLLPTVYFGKHRPSRKTRTKKLQISIKNFVKKLT